MSLPVSQYEALLAEVRGLRRKAQRVQQLATPLLRQCSSENAVGRFPQNEEMNEMEAVVAGRRHDASKANCASDNSTNCSDDEFNAAALSSISGDHPTHQTPNTTNLYHGSWPVEQMWNSDPVSVSRSSLTPPIKAMDVTSVMSFNSSSGGALLCSPSLSRRSSQQLEAKVDMVYSLLAMLSGQEHADMGETLLALSTNPESCLAMRQSGCIPLLVQMVQSDKEPETRKKASQALHNLVHAQPDEKSRKREVRVFKLLENSRAYTEALKSGTEVEMDTTSSSSGDDDGHPVQTVAHLMKLSFDELHRQAICTLGGIYVIANLVEAEHVIHGSSEEASCVLMRRYACMALTNLTFGDSGNKALLCSFREFMRALVVQLQSPSDELRQVTASVLRNLSWRADSSSKEVLREVGAVSGLMKAAMLDNKENTLKSILSALWNLSAHCTENKSEICSVEGALGFLVDMLTYRTPSKSLAIIENSGGILRNISSQVAVREDYREILRQHNCLQVLLEQLKSPSLTIVSNACGTLWNLSAKCAKDQEILWKLGAPSMLRSLNHSKHKMIAMGSSAALKNLLSAKPGQGLPQIMDSTASAMELPVLPTLGARKQKALLQDLDHTLSETYENIEKESPKKRSYEFCSLTEAPSVFEAPLNFSLPHFDNAQFLKCQIAKNPNFCSDSGLSSSVDNDRCRLKEVSVSSDEKDRCSIEDVSDFENLYESSNLSCEGLHARREVALESREATPLLPARDVKYALASSNVTMFGGDVDEIDMDDISIRFLGEEEGRGEKRDEDKEKVRNGKCSVPELPKTTGIPLPRSLPRSIPVSTVKSPKPDSDSEIQQEKKLEKPKSIRSSSGLPRRNVPTSTPIRNRRGKVAGEEGGEGVSEASKLQLQNIERRVSLEDFSPVVDEITVPQVDISNKSDMPYVSPEACVNLNPDATDRDRLLERSCEDSAVDNRMLDPDAMIESLDRFTAELISQASSHLQSKENNTWNEDTSPHEVTFPSISENAPNVISFEIESSADSKSNSNREEEEEKNPKTGDFSSVDTNTSTMTQSTLIAIEASKMAKVFESGASESTSLELDKVQPPSLMESVGSVEKSPKSVRKKSVKGLMLKRALSNSLNASSLESLSNLDHVNPPSAMGDVIDMEGSLTGVDELKADFVINGAITKNHSFLTSKLTSLANSSFVDIENVNPPSLLNEITDLCSSLADIPTETEFEDCQTHVPQTEDDVTEFSDANSATPLQSDMSSAETSPKKTKNPKLMTSKQRRNLARDRYKTYTVAAEMLVQQETADDVASMSETFQTVNCSTSDVYHSVDSRTYSVKPKMTAKERRQNCRSRFETQVVDKAVTDLLARPVIQDSVNLQSHDLLARPVIQDSVNLQSHTDLSARPVIQDSVNLQSHEMVQIEAELVLKNLKETKSVDELLDCETLSLVSNDDDSEHVSASSVNYQTYHKSWSQAKNIPVIEPEKTKPKIVKPEAKEEPEEAPKAIRGRRKPLYSKVAPKTPIKNITSNLVKNVTSSLKSVKPPKPTSASSRVSSGYGTRSTSPKSPKRVTNPTARLATVERQGTFTKDETKSRIPTSKIPRTSAVTSDRFDRNVKYARSTSADNPRSVAVSKTPKSTSNSNLSSANAKKQVTSKIASLWKKIEENKNKPPAKDTRVWIQGQGQGSKLPRSNTFEGKGAAALTLKEGV